MQPLDDFYYFAKVVEHGGYAKAARQLDIPKSRLSRHVTALESRLGVRLVNRSTRRFVVTDVGQEVFRHAAAMLAEADAAVEAVEFVRAKPRGTDPQRLNRSNHAPREKHAGKDGEDQSRRRWPCRLWPSA